MVPRLIVLLTALAAACAAGFVTSTSPAATQGCRLATATKLTGHISMTLNESAHAVVPSTPYSITIALSRQASHVGIHLKRLRHAIGGYYGFVGGASGGSFAVHDSYADNKGTSGTLTADGPARALTTGLFGHPNSCTYQLGANFWVPGKFGGNVDSSGYSSRIADSVLTRTSKVPSSGHMSGSALVPVVDDCSIDYGSAGCVGYSGGWSTDFTMFKKCGTTSAGTCPSSEDTDFGEATISWNLSPG